MLEYKQDKDFNDNLLTNIDSITINRKPTSNNEVSNKKYIDDELDKNTISTFEQTLQNYLKLSVGNDTYNLTKYDKIQIRDTRIIKHRNTDGYLLQKWVTKCNDKNNNGKVQKLNKSKRTNSHTGSTGATTVYPIGGSFMYIETTSDNSGSDNKFFIFERKDIFK